MPHSAPPLITISCSYGFGLIDVKTHFTTHEGNISLFKPLAVSLINWIRKYRRVLNCVAGYYFLWVLPVESKSRGTILGQTEWRVVYTVHFQEIVPLRQQCALSSFLHGIPTMKVFIHWAKCKGSLMFTERNNAYVRGRGVKVAVVKLVNRWADCADEWSDSFLVMHTSHFPAHFGWM